MDTKSLIRLHLIGSPRLPFDAGYQDVLFPKQNLKEGSWSFTNVQGVVRKWQATQGWQIHDMNPAEYDEAKVLLSPDTSGLDWGETRCMAICRLRGYDFLTDDDGAIAKIQEQSHLGGLPGTVCTLADLMASSLGNGTLTRDQAADYIRLILESGKNEKLMTADLVEISSVEEFSE